MTLLDDAKAMLGLLPTDKIRQAFNPSFVRCPRCAGAATQYHLTLDGVASGYVVAHSTCKYQGDRTSPITQPPLHGL